jgi:hypothetical protein
VLNTPPAVRFARSIPPRESAAMTPKPHPDTSRRLSAETVACSPTRQAARAEMPVSPRGLLDKTSSVSPAAAGPAEQQGQ